MDLNTTGELSPVHQDLLAKARQAAQSAYAPYSNFQVGAALLSADGTIITGCNVENASFGLTICAERTAIARAIAEGQKKFQAIAIWADMTAEGKTQPAYGVTPCGACRQVMAEFFDENTVIICPAKPPKHARIFTMNDILPHQFQLEH